MTDKLLHLKFGQTGSILNQKGKDAGSQFTQQLKALVLQVFPFSCPLTFSQNELTQFRGYKWRSEKFTGNDLIANGR